VLRPWLAVLLIVGCDSNAAPPKGAPRPEPTPRPAGDAQVAPVKDANPTTLPGKEMYAALCAPCHGKDLKGYSADNAPSLVTASFLESATDDYLRKSISTGRPGTSMAAYSQKLGGPLDDAAVERLVGYIRAQGPAAKELPPVPKGDVTNGAALYAANCVVCHGDKHNRREGIHLANIMFQAQATDPFIKHAIVNGRPGTKMEGFAGKLSDAQINDVVAYVRSLGAKSEPMAQLPPPTGKEPLIINPKGKAPTWKLRDDRFVAVDDVAKAYKAGAKMIIIDARPPSDWMRAHITGAVSIPYHDVARLKDVPKDTWVVAYCACPHHLSGIVVDELRKLGHTKAVVLDEGINDWHRKGHPMTAADGVQPPPTEMLHPPGDHSGHAH
jgi:mono/diheme cytochrome c family protein/rhodanese-related sulfurtransferase